VTPPPSSAAPAVVVLAGGISARYGRPKALEPAGPSGETLMDYVVFDALRAGCGLVVLVLGEASADSVREHADRFLEHSGVPVRAVVQRLADLPPGRRPPAERRKPWGTGHAVLCAAPHVAGPFLVANTDDFYWPEAYRTLVEELLRVGPSAAAPPLGSQVPTGSSAPPGRTPLRGAVAAYRLADTLPAGGGVSRAILEVDAEGFAGGVTEGKELRREGEGVVGVTAGGDPLALSGEELVSMNLWAFPHGMMAALRARFAAWLDVHGGDAAREFLLTEAVDAEVRDGGARVRVRPVARGGFGITFPEDLPRVRRELARAVVAEGYPADLARALREPSPGWGASGHGSPGGSAPPPS